MKSTIWKSDNSYHVKINIRINTEQQSYEEGTC